jgi:hypothetical protein
MGLRRKVGKAYKGYARVADAQADVIKGGGELAKAEAEKVRLETAELREKQAEGLPWYLQPTLRAILKQRALRDRDIAPEDN